MNHVGSSILEARKNSDYEMFTAMQFIYFTEKQVAGLEFKPYFSEINIRHFPIYFVNQRVK